MKISFYFLNFFFLLAITSQAQEADEMVFQSAFSELAGSTSREELPYYTFNKGGIVNVEGNGLLDQEWAEGVILSFEGELYRAQLRYDAYNDEMQVLSDGKTKALYPARIKGVRLGEQVFVPHAFIENKDKPGMGFFVVLAAGEISLLKRYEAIQQQAAEIHPTQGRKLTGDIKIVIEEAYYYSSKNRPAAKLRTSKGSVLDVLNKRRKAVAKYAKENDLKKKKEKDLIALFDFYNRQTENH